ncbi:hypothetical protein QYM36_000620 [Artemia franciscana]|uniref:Uncharacterized protein n=1 Tax=Artemia franciscana TaxID=6661 RepID=A0AA88ISY3_ARTSF|nr:hypothetical protein QYM36_000620 [Artemia franciscana]
MIKQAYLDVALARSGVFRWHGSFLEGQDEVANENRPKKARMSQSKVKAMLIIFCTSKASSTMNLFLWTNRQCQVLCESAQDTQTKGQWGPTRHRNQQEVAPRKRPDSRHLSWEMLPGQGWHSNASAAALQPRCGPRNFFWFPHQKRPMKGKPLRRERGSKQHAPWLSRLYRRMHTVTPSILGNRAGSAVLTLKEPF